VRVLALGGTRLVGRAFVDAARVREARKRPP